MGHKSAKYGYFAGIPQEPRVLPGNYYFPLDCASYFAPYQHSVLRLSQTRARAARMEHQKHPLSRFPGNFRKLTKCWGTSDFPLGCRKLGYRPNCAGNPKQTSLSAQRGNLFVWVVFDRAKVASAPYTARPILFSFIKFFPCPREGNK